MDSVEEAFSRIESTKEGIPFEAIEYLYNHKSTPEISEKLIYFLDNAYHVEVYYDVDEDRYLNTSLWYAIVAENHLSETLIDPVINLFTTEEEDWDFLNEQGHFLVGLLAQKYPDVFAEKALNAIAKVLEKKAFTPYLFLFDFVYFIDVNRYKERLLNLLAQKDMDYVDAFAMHIADIQLKEAIPVIKEIRQRKNLDVITRNELKFVLEKLETDKHEDEEYAKPYVELRGPWKAHYKPLAKIFYDDYEPERILPPPIKTPPLPSKIGRNEKVSVHYKNGINKRDIKY